ncbi:MAG: uncharacterized protein JWN57_578, partial [Frankiales bacterium]|nr:uncharacterized protein [Frankiales bacterium]
RRLRPEAAVGPSRRAPRGRDAVGTGHPELDRVLAGRAAPVVPAQTRSDRVSSAFSGALDGAPALLDRTDLRLPPEAYAEVLGSVPAAPAAAALVVTPPRPFLRWDPVLDPVVVPRHPYTDGESQLRLVLRSGVEADGTVVPPAEYAAAVRAAHPELALLWREDSSRHLAPPKTSQLTAEQHGLLDAAIGPGSPEARRRALAVSLRDAGTLFDTTIADLESPGVRHPQPGVRLHVGPTADPPQHADAADLPRGDAPSTGQYVVHEVDSLVVPYLPDPLAVGLCLVFPDARPGGHLSGLLAVEGTTLRYRGAWPEPAPYRLVLATGSELHAQVEQDVLTVTVPPGEQLRFRLSSCLDPAQLDLLGLWRSLPAALTGNAAVREAAADGWLWWLTPATEVVLVHAVPRPVTVPRFLALTPERAPDATTATLIGAVDVHGPSTGRLDVEAVWTEQHDDPAKPAPETLRLEAVACGTTVSADEDVVVLMHADGSLPVADGPALRLHAAVHAFGDTRHRTVDYRARATTRYREFFPHPVVPTRDDLSVVSAPRTVSVPSTARPARASVHDVLPLFRWSQSTRSGQPFAVQRTRRAGLRLYLDRPWFSSGDGELLAVLVPAGAPSAGTKRSVSAWGSDPVWAQDGPAREHLLPLDGLLHLVGLDDRRTPGRPVGPPVPLTLPGAGPVLAVGYQPEFMPERGLWCVDVALDPGTAFWPFVQLAVARYQPDSLPGLQLGPVTVCEWAQLAPERALTVARTDETHVQLTLSGPVGTPRGLTRRPDRERVDTFAELLGQSRTVRARLERRDPTVGTDLGWQVEAVTVLPVQGVAGTRVTWAGALQVPENRPARPGHQLDLRVVLEEEERLPADPSPQGQERTSSRVVYRDEVAL